MENTIPASLKGHFLIAMPGLLDPNFFQTVTCISEHTSAGAVGIVVNRVHPVLSAKAIFDELEIAYQSEVADIPIHIGGPVHVGEVFILHGAPFEWTGCFQVTPLLAMSNSRDILEAIAMGRGPESFLLALGCAGWGQGQLESELGQNAWLTSPVVGEIIFSTRVETRWEEAVRRMGIDPAVLSTTAGHA